MRHQLLTLALISSSLSGFAQTGPNITNWLFNTTGSMGQHYVAGNPTPIQDNVLANVQTVQYSNNWVYVSTHGIPAYITGPFQDGNPSIATDQNAIFRFPRVAVHNTGTSTATTPGNIGVFINGVALFDYRDGVAWSGTALCGGPGNPPCPGGMGSAQTWNRDAIPAERAGFDCAKAHPAMGNYHHHQNPSAFDLDLVVISDVCDLYPADGLYAIDAAQHSPLIGFAYDGFPIYGAYGFANTDGSGGVVRMRSSYELGSMPDRTTLPNGATATPTGPTFTQYARGYFREDYQFVGHTEPFYLDVHNGRTCVTPEFPEGTYAYFCTVDENHNSSYPYVVGPSFYGNVTASKVTSLIEPVVTFDPLTVGLAESITSTSKVTVFPNPASDIIAVQVNGLLRGNLDVSLLDLTGRVVRQTVIPQGSTIRHLDTRTLHDGEYIVRIGNGDYVLTKRVVIIH